ncbi:Thyrotropin-releasing hormone receptor [Holothuria leucospilota]|uniref:Thyrotropin-releasing hormone receptor n=1 Tax=Holothuria leucospilota TaxID=206669 RepID=A0A9Q1HB74_HOLLE|nr:Thyrotropin-releasing hormone receptor [Holothuria leucospilota]
MQQTIFEIIQYPHRLSMFEVISDQTKNASQVVQIAIWLFLILCGICTNGAFFYVVLTHSRMRKSVMCRLLLILSVTDVLILFNELLFIMYPFLTMQMDKNFIGEFNKPLVVTCVWFYTLAENFVSAVFTVIAYERYRAICHPFAYIRSSHSILTKIVPILGAVSILYTAVYATVFYVAKISAISLFYLLLFVPPLVPFVTSTVFYLLVSYTLLHTRNATSGEQCHAEITKRKNRKHIVLVLLVNTLVFFILNTLRKCFDSRLARSFRENDWSKPLEEQVKFIENNWHWASYMTICTVLNSMVNPIIYNVGSSEYRKAFLESFACINCCYGNKWCNNHAIPVEENLRKISLQVVSKVHEQKQEILSDEYLIDKD